MSLFQKSVEKKYLNELDSSLIDSKYSAFNEYFGNKLIQQNIKSAKEEQFQEGFLRELFVKILGYTLQPELNYNLISEFKNLTNSRKADGAILKSDEAVAVIELKSLSTTDLDTIESQAFGYKNHHPKCIYVITSNFGKLRFYIQNAVDYIDFDLFNLSRQQFCLLWLCLAKENLLNDVPLKIKESSLLQEENITKKLYADYSKFRNAIYNNLVKNNPELDKLLLFKKTQKLLDRFLFVFFAEDRLLLPPNSIREIINHWETLRDVLDEYIPLYVRFKKYFGYLNTGYKSKHIEVFAYNGGLFAEDEILDNITIDDEILYNHTLKLSQYDFDTEVDVNILGHIFEHSLGEIENVQAEIKGEQVETQKSKRKKDGIYYTPKYITKYIVENTVGKLCNEKRAEFGIIAEEYAVERTKKDKDIIISLDKKLTDYRNWLLTITILDPACGSGAFLNQALEFLIEEHKKIDELRALLFGGGLVFPDITTDILENNIFGVDINEESVEIAKLSLWLRTAQKGRKLNTLSSNIKCGNSLIDDPEVAGEKAFNWQKEFPQVFKEKELKAFHVTWVTYNSRPVSFTNYGSPIILTDDLRNKIAEYLDEKIGAEQYHVIAINVLKDHVHCIIVCNEDDLAEVVRNLKGYSSYKLHQNSSLATYKSVVHPKLKLGVDTGNDVTINPTLQRGDNEKKDTDINPTLHRGDNQKKDIDINPTLQRGDNDIQRGDNDIQRGDNDIQRGDNDIQRGDNDIQRGDNDINTKNPAQKLWAKGYSHTYLNDDSHYLNTIHYIDNNHLKHKQNKLEYKFKNLTTLSEAFASVVVRGGFDVVIGNPPYVNARNMLSIEREFLTKKYCQLTGAWDLYVAFLLKASELSKNNIYGWIIPNKLLINDYGKDTLNLLIKNGLNLVLIISNLPIFENVGVYPIMIINNSIKDELKIYEINDIENLSNIEPFLKKENIFNRYKKIKDFNILINSGTTGFEAQKIKPLINETNEGIEFAVSGSIDPYCIDMSSVPYMKSTFQKPKIKFDPDIISNSKFLFWNTPKIVIAGMTKRLEAFFTDKPIALGVGIYGIYEFDNFNPLYLLAVLNSKFLTYYLVNEFKDKHLSGGYLAINKSTIQELPLVHISPEAQLPFIELADIMLEKNKELQEIKNKFLDLLKADFSIEKLSTKLQNWYELSWADYTSELKKLKIELKGEMKEDWSERHTRMKTQAQEIKTLINQTDKQIDQLVYQLYELSEEEIKVVEGEV
jgi:type I restriction-modification system DNA methylase subunit/REP element-mobilizing transposase RayT